MKMTTIEQAMDARDKAIERANITFEKRVALIKQPPRNRRNVIKQQAMERRAAVTALYRQGLSGFDIAKQCGIGRTVISGYVRRFVRDVVEADMPPHPPRVRFGYPEEHEPWNQWRDVYKARFDTLFEQIKSEHRAARKAGRKS